MPNDPTRIEIITASNELGRSFGSAASGQGRNCERLWPRQVSQQGCSGNRGPKAHEVLGGTWCAPALRWLLRTAVPIVVRVKRDEVPTPFKGAHGWNFTGYAIEFAGLVVFGLLQFVCWVVHEKDRGV